MPQTIYLIRHGQTDDNLHGIIQGQKNSPLNQTGKHQATKLADYLYTHHIDAIYSSDLDRAVATATPLAKKLKLKIHQTPLIRERHMGPFESAPWQEVIAAYPNFAKHVFDTDTNTLGVESNQALGYRSKEFMYQIYTHHQHRQIAIFTHGGTKRTLLKLLLGYTITEEVSLQNTCITTLTKHIPGRYQTHSLAATPHLN